MRPSRLSTVASTPSASTGAYAARRVFRVPACIVCVVRPTQPQALTVGSSVKRSWRHIVHHLWAVVRPHRIVGSVAHLLQLGVRHSASAIGCVLSTSAVPSTGRRSAGFMADPRPGPPDDVIIKGIVERLKESHINMLALDFDLTIIDQHTGGRFSGTADELATHVRPLFRQLIPEAHAAGVHPAIVTFSPQTGMIREVLKKCFPEISEDIPVRGEDGTWRYSGQGDTTGKQGHMASAVEELQQKHSGLVITRASTLLVDDDKNNIHIALNAGVKAVWLDPKNPEEVVKYLLQA